VGREGLREIGVCDAALRSSGKASHLSKVSAVALFRLFCHLVDRTELQADLLCIGHNNNSNHGLTSFDSNNKRARLGQNARAEHHNKTPEKDT
jgi:hypothetical protein